MVIPLHEQFIDDSEILIQFAIDCGWTSNKLLIEFRAIRKQIC